MKIVSLQSLLEYTDEGSIKKNFLENFKSIETNDIEIFLHEKAIKYEKDSISSTHLVFNENGTLVGYFSIANKGLVITEYNYKILSNTQKRKLTYSGRKLENSVYIVNSYLLGQIGKNYNISKEEMIEGIDLLTLAFNLILEAKKIINAKYVWLECENKNKLIDFYNNFGFQKIKDFRSENNLTVMIMKLKKLDK